MANANVQARRPLSPHLQIYKPIPNMVMSIMHRITGGAIYFGTLLIAWWVVTAAVGPDAFALASAVLGSWFGLMVLVGYSWALIHHMLGGIRHLIWDTGRGLDKSSATTYAHATWIGSVALTVLFWAIIYVTKG